MRSIRSLSISWTRSARSTNSSCTCPVLKLRLVVSRSEASSTARVVSALASSRRASRSPPPSPGPRVHVSPARRGDVGAAFFQRAGDAFRNFVDARGDRIRDQRDVVAQVDLHAGDGAANLLGLTDQVVALMGDILQQRADAHLV